MRKDSVQVSEQLERYFRWPLFYIIVLAVMTIVAAVFDTALGLIFCLILIIATLISVYLLWISRKQLMNEVIQFAFGLNGHQKEQMQHFEMPYILIDSGTRIQWYNEAFLELSGIIKYKGIKLSNVLPVLASLTLPEDEETRFEKVYEIGDEFYRVVFRKVSIQEKNKKEKSNLYAGYFFNISKQVELETKYEEQKAVFALIYVDNYEEVIHSIEDVRRPLLVALIDRHINKLCKDIDGVIRKFEKDKYFIAFQKKYLSTLEQSNFSILNSVREINIGNELPVTLSIGVGIHDTEYGLRFDYAKTAMDLALGRGGDQAVVKYNENFSFYGGKTRGIEKSTRVKARMKAHAFRELIEETEQILIMGHKLGDMDSLGASMGVYACAKHFGKPAHIVIDKVTTAISTIYDQIISDKDYPSDIIINSTQVPNYISDQTLLVVVDVNRPSYMEYPDILKMVEKIVVFDHHRVTADHIENAVLSYIEPYASSTCEMITEITQYISDKIKLKSIEADALFAGITVDTKNFVAKSGVKTFEAAAFLRRNGADSVRVNRLFKNDMASYKAKATAVKDAEIYRDMIAISICPSNVVNPNLISAQAADELLNIYGIKASFVLTYVESVVYISARSIDDINVQIIMEKLGGGGHLSVAGAQLENITIEKAIEKLKSVIDEYFEKGDK